MGKKVIIIGSGFSALTAACYLAKSGCEVNVFEKNEQVGGRASVFRKDGYSFDMGPSWYWMPDVFEKFFKDFGYSSSDFYNLVRLDPAYRVYFDSEKIDIQSGVENIISTFIQIDPSCENALRKFLNQAEENYKIAIQNLVYQPGFSITELITVQTALRLPLFVSTISEQVKKITQNPHLQSILEFPVLFLGAKPSQTPAFYNFMNHADFGLGTWYPEGGMGKVVEAMVSIANKYKVNFHTDTCVEEVLSYDEVAVGISTNKGNYYADIIVSGADYAHTDKLLGKNANYKETYWENKTFAPSSILYYVGFKGKAEHVLHHNLFFDTDFEKHSESIYDTKIFPEKPLFYANFPSLSDNTLAPEGHSTAFFLIPVAPGLYDTQKLHDTYFDSIVKRLKKHCGLDIKDKIEFKKSFGIRDFESRYNSCKGNAYGLANTLLQTSILRPKIRNKNLYNFFYTGQLTVPGPGVPPAIISGKIVSDFILKKYL